MKMRKQKIVMLETVFDHLTGEEIGQAIETLNAMPQILDAAVFSGIGKKNRPAWLLQALCLPEHEEAVVAAVFRHTHTLGIRRMEMERYILPRCAETMERGGQSLPAKGYALENEEYARPEADAVKEFCAARGLGAPAFRFGKDE